MINLRQTELALWQVKNFGQTNSDDMFTGMCEEFGELCHYILKRKQNIREGHNNKCIDEICDSVIDLNIFAMQLLSCEGIAVNQMPDLDGFDNSYIGLDTNSLKRLLLNKLNELNKWLVKDRRDIIKYAIFTEYVSIYQLSLEIIKNEGREPEHEFNKVILSVLQRDWKKNPKGDN